MSKVRMCITMLCVKLCLYYALISGSEGTKTIEEFGDERKQQEKRRRSKRIIAFEEKKENGESKRKKDSNYSSPHLQMMASIQVITLILVFILHDQLCFLFSIDKENNHSCYKLTHINM